jgi:hypothetical protein
MAGQAYTGSPGGLPSRHGDALGQIAAGPIREAKAFPALSGTGPVGGVGFGDGLGLCLLQALLELREVAPGAERFPLSSTISMRGRKCAGKALAGQSAAFTATP